MILMYLQSDGHMSYEMLAQGMVTVVTCGQNTVIFHCISVQCTIISGQLTHYMYKQYNKDLIIQRNVYLQNQYKNKLFVPRVR